MKTKKSKIKLFQKILVFCAMIALWHPFSNVSKAQCFNIQYHEGFNIQCGCDDDLDQCLPVSSVNRIGYMACIDSGDTYSGTCADVTQNIDIGSKYPCEAALNATGQDACAASLTTAGISTLYLLSPTGVRDYRTWLTVIGSYYVMFTTCTYCSIFVCNPSSTPSKDYYRNNVRPTGNGQKESDPNNPVYNYPACGA